MGAEALWRHNICCDPLSCYDACDTTQTCVRRDLLIGFRYLRSRVDSLVVQMEKEAMKLIEAIHGGDRRGENRDS